MTLLFKQQWQSSHANLDMSYLALIQLLQKIIKCKQNSGSYYTNIFNRVIFCLWINFSQEYCSVTCSKIQKSFSSLKLISLQLRVRNLILFFFFLTISTIKIDQICNKNSLFWVLALHFVMRLRRLSVHLLSTVRDIFEKLYNKVTE